MTDTNQQPALSTKLYNALMRETKTPIYHEPDCQPYTDTPHLLNPAIIRRALADGAIYGWRGIGPKSIEQIKKWLGDPPPAQPTEEHMTSDPTVTDIIRSLTRRGFIRKPNYFDAERIQTQLDAVIEELGEVARMLRRARQARQALDDQALCIETADVVIAAVCLFAHAAGSRAPAFVAEKLAADDARGWLHSGLTREQYEHRS
jgi:NTP pyrophosphatase (non-canonical NTP hydrolase)